jgi:serine/threonine-protein kinase
MSDRVVAGDLLAGKYRVERVLGSGGLGVVVAARHIQLDVPVALKFMTSELLSDATFAARFQTEARAAAKLRSEHAVRVTDVGTLESGAPYLVMELLEGSDLSAHLSKLGPLPIARGVEFVAQACDVLDEAHRAGIVHGDINPSKLFLTKRTDGTPCIKVLGFGISRVADSAATLHITGPGVLLRSVFYMAPEQMRDPRVDAKGDIWSLGVTLYELLTGRLPFEAKSLFDFSSLVIERAPKSAWRIRPEIPAALEQVVLRCLRKDPSERFASARALATALAAFTPQQEHQTIGLNTPAATKDPSTASSDSAHSFLRAAVDLSEPSQLTVDAAYGRVAPRIPVDRLAGDIVAKRYRLDRELGRGGMGVVWAATHTITQSRVAIKFLKGHGDLRGDLRRRFLLEGRAACEIDHPNIVRVLDVFELEDETPVMVMELLDGETLRDTLEREQRLSLTQATSILIPVVSAVGAGHARGIVHRDLKPENIFLARGPKGERVKVLDFGIAKFLTGEVGALQTDSGTTTGVTLGTLGYMAPEQMDGAKDIDPLADVWSIGVVLYECLAGVRPLQGSRLVEVAIKLATEGIRPLGELVPELPAEAASLVMRMLARERADRPPDLRHVHEVLSRFSDINLSFAPT